MLSLYRSPDRGDCSYVEKRQWVRLLDIFVLGPVGIWLGQLIVRQKQHTIDPRFGWLVVLYGVLTIAYNAANYIENVLSSNGE